MNNEQINQIIQGIGTMTELWAITYQSFKNQGMSNIDAMTHTKSFMAAMMESSMDMNR